MVKWIILIQIGEGGYSSVYRVRDSETSEGYAVKKVCLSGFCRSAMPHKLAI